MHLGTVSCDEGTRCCLYADVRGETLRAELGEIFNDGCNEGCKCTKTRRNRGPWSCDTDKKCSCKFMTWDMVWAYAGSGHTVSVYDKKDKCTKKCTCKARKPGRKEKVDCKEESCIYF